MVSHASTSCDKINRYCSSSGGNGHDCVGHGLMVSYRYDAKHIEDRHEHYIADHTVALSEALLNEAKQIRP